MKYDDGSEQLELPLDLPEPLTIVPSLTEEQVLAQTQLAQLQQENGLRYRELLLQGARPDSGSVAMARINTLIDMALSPEERLHYDIAFEHHMVALLTQCLTEIRQRKLAEGAAVPPGNGKLIVPGM